MALSKYLTFPALRVTAFLLSASVAPAAEPKSSPNHFEKDIAAFEAADVKTPPPQGAILFAGDSTFTRWKSLHEDLPGYVTINRGFGGSQMSDLLEFTDRIVLPYKPREELFVEDRMHPSHAGYQLRVEILRPILGTPECRQRPQPATD